MVLAQLGGSISRALQQMSNATIIDEKVLNECLNEITRALLQSDVQFKLVRDMQSNIKKIVNLDDLAAGHNKRKIIQQVQPFFFIFSHIFLTFYHFCFVLFFGGICDCYDGIQLAAMSLEFRDCFGKLR